MRFFFALLLFSSICFAQDLRRPGTDQDGGNNLSLGCTGQNLSSSAMPLAHDSAGLSTQSSQVTGGTTNTNFRTRLFLGWIKNVTPYTAVSLNVFATSAGWRAGAGLTGNSCVAYSVDAGNTWTSFICDGGLSGGNGYGGLYTATLSSTQDLSKVQVGVCTQGTGTTKGNGSDDIEVYDIYTLGTTTPVSPGTGPTKGQPHRGVVVIN